ncbi:hypothetical protein OSB04_012746, partial [Centaurea solstitialis]
MASISQASIFLVFIATLLVAIAGDPQVPCYFIFGDSLMDNGNNNNLHTNAKVNFAPYGIDFPDGPTGRFSNGRNIADVIAQLLGFESFIQPFATARNDEIIKGVNYASGGAGIREETGQHLLGRSLAELGNTYTIHIYMDGQQRTISATTLFPNTIKQVVIFTEEYAFYLKQRKKEKPLDKFNLQELYTYGARKFGIFAAGYSGCTPGIMAIYGVNSCVDSDLNVTNKPCCEVSSSINGNRDCSPIKVPCKHRQNYLFWDASIDGKGKHIRWNK